MYIYVYVLKSVMNVLFIVSVPTEIENRVNIRELQC